MEREEGDGQARKTSSGRDCRSSPQISRGGKSLIAFLVFKDELSKGGKGHNLRLNFELTFFRMFSYDRSHKD